MTSSSLTDSKYQGRFAPSPTGPLHFGSLVAATGSYLQAKHQNGKWFVRIDDIDPPREVEGASTKILQTLEEFGFEWDGEVSYQSQRTACYQDAVDELLQQKLAYPCSCSRASILNATGQASGHVIYPGFCRHHPQQQSRQHSIRLLTEDITLTVNDKLLGEHTTCFDTHVGDFIIKRADGFYAYHLATGIDDAIQGITEVVRGADLFTSTTSQIYIQQLLGLSTPGYLHLPIARNNQGEKLSKQTFAPAINTEQSIPLLLKTLKFLGQQPPTELESSTLNELWYWAIRHWDLSKV